MDLYGYWNRGMIASQKSRIGNAKDGYIAFQDDDVIFLPEKPANQTIFKLEKFEYEYCVY